MGYLLPILLALGSLALDEMQDVPLARWPWAVLAIAPLPYVFAYLERRSALTGAFRLANLWSRIGRVSPVLMQYIAIAVFGWSASLEKLLDTEISVLSWPTLSILLALAPYLLYTLITIDSEARQGSSGAPLRSHMRAFQIRMFLAGLGPIVGYVLLASLVGRWNLARVLVEEVAVWGYVFTFVLGLGFVFFLPFFLRMTWETESLPAGPERELLEGVAKLANFRCREILIWKTGDLMSNAAIVGLGARTRCVFFTDALLRKMGPRQLAAVFAHEIGHAKRHHVPIFIIWALAFFGALDALLTGAELGDEALEMTVLGVALVLWLLAFGWLSRRAELEADLYSFELLRDGIGITSALQSVAPSSHSKTGWRHFSTRDRIAFLERVAVQPHVGVRLRRQVRTLAALGALVLLIAGTWRISTLLEDYAPQRTLADLRLGRYATAVERASSWGVNDGEEGLQALRDLVGQASAGGLTDFAAPEAAAERCSALALLSLERADLRAAEHWLSLAGLAGDRSADEAAHVLAAAREKEASPPAPAPALGPDLGPWLEPLERALGACVTGGDP